MLANKANDMRFILWTHTIEPVSACCPLTSTGRLVYVHISVYTQALMYIQRTKKVIVMQTKDIVL